MGSHTLEIAIRTRILIKRGIEFEPIGILGDNMSQMNLANRVNISQNPGSVSMKKNFSQSYNLIQRRPSCYMILNETFK